MNYTETIDFLYKRLPVFHHIGKAAYKANLNNILNLSKRLDDPHLKFRSVHIAGTNGKGSVSHMLASVLQQAGYKTGLYTSPHLIDFCERIKINGHDIPKEFVVSFVEKKMYLIEEINPSFFELTTAIAFEYFHKENVDIAIIETGLGGRLDATNIIKPLLSVITNISLDHTDILGDTIERIAHEKAGIIKERIPVVIGESKRETSPVFIQKATELDCPIFFADKQFEANTVSSSIFKRKLEVTRISTKLKNTYTLDLAGLYQEKNIKTVLTALDVLKDLDFNFNEKDVCEGLENAAQQTGLKGRWHVLQQNPLIVTDTGHNEAGILILMEQVLQLQYNKLHIVFGMVSDKDSSKVLSLMPNNALYYFTKASVIRAKNEIELANQAKEYGLTGANYPNVKEAITDAMKNAGPADVIFAGGSTFIAAEVIEIFSKNL